MLENFKWAGFRFQLKASDPIYLSQFIGSTLRGAFGYAFKDLVCIVSHRDCPRCLLRDKCSYPYVFETPVPTGSTRMRKYPTAPHPFVLSWAGMEDHRVPTGETFHFDLALIGKAIGYLPYFIYVFDELGRRGLGATRGKYGLICVYSLANGSQDQLIYSDKDRTLKSPYHVHTLLQLLGDRITDFRRLTIRFRSPTRIKYEGGYIVDLEFHILLRTLLRRIASLSYFHAGENLEVDFRGLIDKAREVVCVERKLAWRDLRRYSTRQEADMNLGGFIGETTFVGDMSEFMPFLWLGEHVHVGKGTSFGLGKYEILARIDEPSPH